MRSLAFASFAFQFFIFVSYIICGSESSVHNTILSISNFVNCEFEAVLSRWYSDFIFPIKVAKALDKEANENEYRN